MSPRKLDTPTAILLAGALIGGGLFFGLQGRAVEPPSSPLAEPTPARLPSAPEAPPRAALVEQATRALEPQRAALVARCWAPAVQAQPAPPRISYVLNFSFDAGGRQIMRGIVEDRPTARPSVTRCVSETLAPVAIPPPGAPVRVDVPLVLP